MKSTSLYQNVRSAMNDITTRWDYEPMILLLNPYAVG